jgi:Tfp pilus assembly protein PilX
VDARRLSRTPRVLTEEGGFALVLALGVMVVLGMAFVTVIESTASNQRSSNMSTGRGSAYTLAEAGLNNAMAILRSPSNNAIDAYVFCPDSTSLPTLPCVHTDTYTTGQVMWQGTLSSNPAAGTWWWNFTSTGHVRNPSGGADLMRTIKATIPVAPVTSQPLNNPSWNYIFDRAPNWSGVAFSGCDMTIANSVNVTSPLYVLGNLCFQNTAQMTKTKLYVKGSLSLAQSANTIGTSSVPIDEAHVGLGCKYQSNASHNPCVNADNVYAYVIDGALPAVTPPTADWDGWYLNGSPGPYFPCAAPAGGDPPNPTFLFDNPVAAMTASDATKLSYRNDNQGIVNLTPTASYKCKTASGEISWDYPSRTLTISGTIFVDGSAVINIGGTVLYKGAATLYTWGTMLVKNTNVCAYSAGTSCTTSNWDSTKDLFAIVSHGNGSIAVDNQVAAGDSVQFVSSHFEGAVYAQNAIDISTTALVDGPLDGATVILGQSSSSTFNGFTFVPAGLPGENTVYALVQTPQITGG